MRDRRRATALVIDTAAMPAGTSGLGVRAGLRENKENSSLDGVLTDTGRIHAVLRAQVDAVLMTSQLTLNRLAVRTLPWALLCCMVFSVACGATSSAVAQGMSAELEIAADSIESKVVAWRRDFHAHPELSNREVRTAGKCREASAGTGLELDIGIAHRGVAGLLRESGMTASDSVLRSC